MRILYHHRTLGEDAEGIHIEGMVHAFRKLGHEVKLLSLMPTGGGARAEKGRRLGRLVQRLPRALYEVAEVGYNLKAYPELAGAIRRFQPDLVYNRYNLYEVAVVAAARAAKVPTFLEVNTPYAYQRRLYEKLHFPWLASRLESHAWHQADRVLVVSTPLKHYVQKVGVPESRIDVMPNGADLDLFDFRQHRLREDRDDGTGEVTIGFVGSLRRWHGVELLLEAVAPLVPLGARVIIVGDGPEREALERDANERGIGGAVQFRGKVPHETTPEHIADFDIAVSPRSVFYQSPMKILEYMAMKRPVVASDSENVRDLVDHEKEALLFRPDDPASFREALTRLIQAAELRRRLGEQGRSRVETRHTWIGNAHRVIERWQQLGGRGPGSARPTQAVS